MKYFYDLFAFFFLFFAGGRNVTISLESRTGHVNMKAVAGMMLFIQHWYWFPLAHCLALAFTPTTIIALNSKLKVSFRSNIESRSRFCFFLVCLGPFYYILARRCNVELTHMNSMGHNYRLKDAKLPLYWSFCRISYICFNLFSHKVFKNDIFQNSLFQKLIQIS